MFHKENFITKLVFFIRVWLGAGGDLLIMYGYNTKLANEIKQIYFQHMVMLLYTGRQEGLMEFGINDKETYKAFCDIISIGLSQLNEKIISVYQQNDSTSDVSKLLLINVLIDENVKEIADDIEELFKPVIPCKNN